MTQRATLRPGSGRVDGDYIYFVTTNVHQGRWFFYTTERAARLGQAIQTCCRMKHFDLLAYCILPNHLHFLVRKLGIDEINNLSSAFGAHRTLESARCGDDKKPLSSHPRQATDIFLFPHRRPHRTRGRMRCEEGGKPFPNGTSPGSSAFLFPDRRRPRLRPFQADQRFTLSQLMHSIKSTFAHSLARGRFWHRRSYFRIIGSEEYLGNVIEYIRFNYTKMNLPERYGEAPVVFIDQSAIDRVFNECGSC